MWCPLLRQKCIFTVLVEIGELQGKRQSTVKKKSNLLFYLHITNSKVVNPSVHVIHRWFKHDSACSNIKVYLFMHIQKNTEKLCRIQPMCVWRKCISSIVELRGVRLIRGLPRGVSSLVEFTVVGADVADVGGSSVVSVVRLGAINCT